jgi:DNA-binding NtrC family response regulator
LAAHSEERSQSSRPFGLVLVVEDDRAMRAAIVRLFRPRAVDVLEAGTVARAKALLRTNRISLVVLDVRLKDESGIEVAAFAASRVPAPPVIAVSGAAGPEEAFTLAQHGVRAFIPKAELPARMDELASIVRQVPPLDALVKAQVGVRSVREVQEAVRDAMLEQALALEDGNLAAAAKRLGVSRQAVQQMKRRRGKDD